jgi:hypothetical protein
MTPEERFEQIERLHAEQIEMAKQDRAAYIAWKRDMESRVDATWVAINRMAEESRKAIKDLAGENKRGMTELRREIAARDAVTDKRIGDLVTAIGQLIQRMDGKFYE